MDPRSATITATEIVVNAIKAAQTYNDYQSRRNNATLTLLSLIAECNCVSVALHQIHGALLKHPSIAACLTAEDDASGKTFNSVLAACQVTFRVLHEQATKYNESTTETERSFGITSKRHKAKLVWNDKDIQSISRNVSGIVGGLNLLLQALSFKTTLEIQSQLADKRSSVVAEQLADDAISLVSSHHSSSSWSLLDYRQSMTEPSRPGSSWSLMGLALADATLSSSVGDIHYLSVADTEFVTQVTEALKQEKGHTIIGVSDTELNCETRRLALQSPDGLSIALTHRNLKTIPHDWIDLVRTRLERLAISHNELRSLPEAIGLCSRLSYLSIRYNNFRNIPDCVFDIETLEILDVSHNGIVKIPDKIASLKNLRVLAIGGNKIQVLPRCIGFMASLQVLNNEQGNPLSEPPQSLLNQLIPPDTTLEKKNEIFEEQTTCIKAYLKNSSLINHDRDEHVILCLRCGRALGYSHEGQYTVQLLTIPLWRLFNIEAAKCTSCVTGSMWRFAGLVGSDTICVTCVQRRWPLACCGYCDKV